MARKQKTQYTIFILIGIILLGLVINNYLALFGWSENNLTEYSVSEAQQNVPFTAKLVVGDNVENFVITPNYNANSWDDKVDNLIWNNKYEIYNFKTNSWELIEQKNFNLNRMGHYYISLKQYGKGLYTSPTKYVGKEISWKTADKQYTDMYACFEGAVLPSGYTTGGGSVYTPKCFYPGELSDCTNYDRSKDSSKGYCYFPQYYYYSKDYLNNGIADIRITYLGNLRHDPNVYAKTDRFFAIILIHKELGQIIDTSGYSIINNECIFVQENAEYDTLYQCQSALPEPGYIIQNNQCVYVDDNADFTDLSQCQNQLATPGYKIENGICVHVEEGSVYSTLEQCQDALPKPGYVIQNNKCVYVEDYSDYESKVKCELNLTKESPSRLVLIVGGGIILLLIIFIVYLVSRKKK